MVILYRNSLVSSETSKQPNNIFDASVESMNEFWCKTSEPNVFHNITLKLYQKYVQSARVLLCVACW